VPKKLNKSMRVAIVYDRVNKIGGAEKVLLALHKIWPQAPLFTAFYHPQTAKWAKDFKIRSIYSSRTPLLGKNHELFPWLASSVFESFPFDKYDVVISITSAEAKSIITKPGTLHICYCLTPTRYLWSGFNSYVKNPGFGIFNPLVRTLFNLLAPKLRLVDQVASTRPDCYIAISKTVEERIKKYYRRESVVIYPPVEVEKIRHQPSKTKYQSRDRPYFLVVSRLVPYKNIDLIVRAFNELGWNLKIIGIGNQMTNLKRTANSNINFLGQINEERLYFHYHNCQALVVAAEEDFGITILEAQAAGKPVIALGKAGARETIVNKKTGLVFDKLTVEDLKLALLQFNKLKFKALVCQNQAAKFSEEIFINKFKNFVEDQWHRFKN
jgi:glycosyltransferase involved in cell wall biosynthesis